MTVSTATPYDGALYISGNFQFLDDPTLYGILRFDGHQLCALGGEMPAGSGPIEFFPGYLYNGLPAVPQTFSTSNMKKQDRFNAASPV